MKKPQAASLFSVASTFTGHHVQLEKLVAVGVSTPEKSRGCTQCSWLHRDRDHCWGETILTEASLVLHGGLWRSDARTALARLVRLPVRWTGFTGLKVRRVKKKC